MFWKEIWPVNKNDMMRKEKIMDIEKLVEQYVTCLMTLFGGKFINMRRFSPKRDAWIYITDNNHEIVFSVKTAINSMSDDSTMRVFEV